jgi:hypothetical protein
VQNANEKNDWRIYQNFAQLLIFMSIKLDVRHKLRVSLDEIIYGFDCNTIDLSIKHYPCTLTNFGRGNAKMLTHINHRGSTPTFIDFISGIADISK